MAQSQSQAKPKRKRVVITFEHATAQEVILVGDFNQWNPKRHVMKRESDGVWKRILMLPKGSYEYRLIVDGTWQNDPKNEHVVPNCFGTMNNVLTVS